ncbi:major facilitator superfamily domain-containing protein 3-like isoform X2 [Oratosquilla oratoria]
MMSSKKWNLGILGLFYMVEGIPYGIHEKFLPTFLRSRGHSYSSVTLMSGLQFPWIIKGLWAPFIEILGGHMQWLCLSLILLGMSCLAACIISLNKLQELSMVLLTMSIFVAILDVCVDSIVLKTFPEEELTVANSVQVVLYKVGMWVGGTALLVILEYLSWNMSFILLAILYFSTAAVATIHGASTPQDSKELQKHENRKERNASLVSIVQDILKIPGTKTLIGYLLLCKVGEKGAVTMLPLLLMDKGMSIQSLAFWNGTVCQSLSIMGSFMGGRLVVKNKLDLIKKLSFYERLRTFIVLAQFIFVTCWDIYEPVYSTNFVFHGIGILSLCALNYVGGVITVLIFTLMMMSSKMGPLEAQSSHLNVMASVEIIGKLMFGMYTGSLVDTVGFPTGFAVFWCSSFLSDFVGKKLMEV